MSIKNFFRKILNYPKIFLSKFSNRIAPISNLNNTAPVLKNEPREAHRRFIEQAVEENLQKNLAQEKMPRPMERSNLVTCNSFKDKQEVIKKSSSAEHIAHFVFDNYNKEKQEEIIEIERLKKITTDWMMNNRKFENDDPELKLKLLIEINDSRKNLNENPNALQNFNILLKNNFKHVLDFNLGNFFIEKLLKFLEEKKDEIIEKIVLENYIKNIQEILKSVPDQLNNFNKLLNSRNIPIATIFYDLPVPEIVCSVSLEP